MKLSVFLHHQWLNFWRGRNANKSLALQIIMGLFYLLVFLEIAGLGIVLPFVLEELVPGKDPVAVFTSYIIYYYMVGLLVRLQLQELPSLSIQPYLTQNISRKTMLRFLNVRSLFHIINFLPLFVFIPFTIVQLAPKFGSVAAIAFLIAQFSLVVNNHFLTMYLKRKSVNSAGYLIAILLLIAGFKSLDYFKLISFEETSTALFTGLLQHPGFSLGAVALAVGTFTLNNRYLRNHLYLEELASEKNFKISTRYNLLDKYGQLGEMLALELKLISRNKRPRSTVIISGVILLYGLLFYPQYLASENYTTLFLFALLVTGIFVTNYGQFLFSWQSSHFDGMMCYNLNMRQFIKTKFTLFVIVCTLQFSLACFYGFMGWQIIPIQVAAYLYSAGVNTYVTIYAATFNYKYLNLTKSASMNFQGIGAVQWLQSLLVAAVPVLVFFLLNRFAGYWVAVGVISLVGVIGLLMQNILINWLVLQFELRKHKILDGFRER